MTKTQKLQIGAATVLYDCFKVIAGFLRIRFSTIWNMSVSRVDIYVREQIIIHKVIIALIVAMCQSAVFVQIDGSNFRKIQIPFFVPVYQCLISTDR